MKPESETIFHYLKKETDNTAKTKKKYTLAWHVNLG